MIVVLYISVLMCDIFFSILVVVFCMEVCFVKFIWMDNILILVFSLFLRVVIIFVVFLVLWFSIIIFVFFESKILVVLKFVLLVVFVIRKVLLFRFLSFLGVYFCLLNVLVFIKYLYLF